MRGQANLRQRSFAYHALAALRPLLRRDPVSGLLASWGVIVPASSTPSYSSLLTPNAPYSGSTL